MFKRTLAMKIARRDINKHNSIVRKELNSFDYKNKQFLELCDTSYNIKANVVKINYHNTDAHEISKFIVALDLIKSGKTIYAEVIFKNGLRADIVCIDDLEIYEILHSERDESIKLKSVSYPLPIRSYRTSDVLTKYLKKSVNV